MSSRVSGSIPQALLETDKLVSLRASRSQLSGTLPIDELENSKVYTVWIHETKLCQTTCRTALVLIYSTLITTVSGTLPIAPVSFQGLSVSNSDKLSGTLPESMDQLASLKELLVYANEFSGTVSDGWVLCSVSPLTCSALQHVLSVVVQNFTRSEPPQSL